MSKQRRRLGPDDVQQIPGVGPALAEDLANIGIHGVSALRGQDPEALYELTNRFEGATQDRCVLYVYRCAVYYAETPSEQREPEKLKWWTWQDAKPARTSF